MTYHAYPSRGDGRKERVEIEDISLAVEGETEDDVIIAVASNVDFNKHTGVIVLNGQTWEVSEHKL